MIRGRSLLLHLLSQFPKDSIKFDECGALMVCIILYYSVMVYLIYK